MTEENVKQTKNKQTNNKQIKQTNKQTNKKGQAVKRIRNYNLAPPGEKGPRSRRLMSQVNETQHVLYST